MASQTIFFILLFTIQLAVNGDFVGKKNGAENDHVVGIKTINKVKIDKDTVITRNLKLENRRNGNNHWFHVFIILTIININSITDHRKVVFAVFCLGMERLLFA